MGKKLLALRDEMFGEAVPTKRWFFNFVAIMAPIFSFFATLANLISGTCYGDNKNTGLLICALCTVICSGIYPFSKHFNKIDFFIYLAAFGMNLVIFPALFFTVGGLSGSMPIYFVIGIVFSILMLDNKKMQVIIALISYAWYAIVFYIEYTFHISEKFTPVLFEKTIFVDTFFDFVVVSACIAFLVKILANNFEKQQSKTDSLLRQMEELSVKDPLTGAYNRRFLIKYLQTSIQNSHEQNKNMAIVMFDIDKFKRINDDYGHLTGDEVIKALATALMSSCRDYDIVSRYGGEEFILVMPGASEEVGISRAEQIRQTFETLKISDEIDRPVTISGGVAEIKASTTTPEDFIAMADDHLYVAKETGRNKIIGTTYNQPAIPPVPGIKEDDR